MHTIRKAMADMTKSLRDAVQDPRMRDETEEAGSAFLAAFGATLSDMGEALQSEARERHT